MTNFDYIINTYDNLPFLVRIAWFFSAVLALIIVILALNLKLIRFKLRKRSIEKTQLQEKYESLIVEYLYSGDGSDAITETQNIIIEKIKEISTVEYKRKIVVSILFDLMNEVSGEMTDTITTFYYKTGLVNHAFDKLKHKKWHVIAKGIFELRRFRIKTASHKVTDLINHPRSEVKKEIHLYMVNLFLFDGLSFLDDLQTMLSEWEQIQLLETLQKFENQEICDIRPWIKSTNNSVVMFALKLAKMYNQFEVKDDLMALLSHPNKEIRVDTINVLSHLYGIEAKEMLKASFSDLSLEEQISFFDLLEKLVVPDDEPFVEKHLFHKNFEIQLLALKILKEINIDKYIKLSKLPDSKKSPAMIKAEIAI